jgi:chaperonin GroES
LSANGRFGPLEPGTDARRMYRGSRYPDWFLHPTNQTSTINIFCNKERFAMAKTKFTPLHDRILVRRLEEGESVRGGIIIPDSAKEKPQQGEVIAVGKGKSNDEGKVFPLDVKAGDTILFGNSGTEIKLDGEEFLIMREEEVLGIVKK